MRCSVAAQQLQLYIDHRLAKEQFHALEAHIAQCTTCQRQLVLLEEVVSSLSGLQPVAEPADMTVHIMQRVAEHPRRSRQGDYSLLRPSLLEIAAIFFLATVTTLGFIWNQPALRKTLPFANGHGIPNQTFLNTLGMLVASNSGPLMLALWIVGTLLGIWITLALVGDEMRAQWIKAMMDRLPVR